MIKTFEQLFCKHDYRLNRWHYTHGVNGDEPRSIEYEYVCSKCAKKKYTYSEMKGE